MRLIWFFFNVISLQLPQYHK